MSAREHDAVRELLPSVALGAADPAETARVEAHLAECPVCREELEGLRAGAGILAVDVPQREPSPALRTAVMSAVREDAARRAAEHEEATRPARAARRDRWRVFRTGPALAIACAVAALVIAIAVTVTVPDSAGPSRGVTTVAVAGTPDAPGVTGHMVYVADEDTAIVNLDHLPALPAGEAYQLWVLRDGRARSAGLFEATGPARARRVVTGLAGADALAVTAQPRSNTTTPEGPILLNTPLPA